MRYRTKVLLRWVAAAFTLVSLALILRGVPWAESFAALSGADPWLLTMATLLNLVSLLAKGLAWWVFLRPEGLASPREPIRGSVVGAALNNLAPWNLGDVGRVAMLADAARVPVVSVARAFALERGVNVISGAMLAAMALPWVRLPFTIAPVGRFAIAGAVLLGLMLLLVRRQAAPAAMALGVVSWLGQLACYHLVALAVGLGMPVWATVDILIACNLGFIVRLTPGGVGVFQVAYTATAVALGLPKPLSLASSLLVQAVQIVPVMLVAAPIAPWPWRVRRDT